MRVRAFFHPSLETARCIRRDEFDIAALLQTLKSGPVLEKIVGRFAVKGSVSTGSVSVQGAWLAPAKALQLLVANVPMVLMRST